MRDETPLPEPEETAFVHLDQALTRAAAGTEDDCLPDPNAPTASKTVLLSVIFGLAVLLLAAVIGYTSSVFAVDRAEAHTDDRIAVLEKDLQQRRAVAAAQNANRDAQIAELRRLVCVLADHSQPRDASVQEVRARYGCDGLTPGLTPGPSTGPSPSPSATGSSRPPRK